MEEYFGGEDESQQYLDTVRDELKNQLVRAGKKIDLEKDNSGRSLANAIG